MENRKETSAYSAGRSRSGFHVTQFGALCTTYRIRRSSAVRSSKSVKTRAATSVRDNTLEALLSLTIRYGSDCPLLFRGRFLAPNWISSHHSPHDSEWEVRPSHPAGLSAWCLRYVQIQVVKMAVVQTDADFEGEIARENDWPGHEILKASASPPQM